MDNSDLGPMDDGLQDLGLPVPVQTFLWGQIAPFIRPKLGKLHEATCQVSSKKTGLSTIILPILRRRYSISSEVFFSLKCHIHSVLVFIVY